MHVNELSALVLKLTGSAVERRPQEHQTHMIDQLRRIVQFDAAWWGWSNFASGGTTLVRTEASSTGICCTSVQSCTLRAKSAELSAKKASSMSRAGELGRPEWST